MENKSSVPKPKQHWRVVLGISMLMVIIAGGISWYWTTRDDRAYQQAVTLLTEKRYEEAEREYLEFRELYPQSPLTTKVQDDLPHLYFEWGHFLLGDKNYEQALEKFTILQNKYPNSPQSLEVQKDMQGLYFEWARFLRKQENYEQAFEKLAFLQEMHSDNIDPLTLQSELVQTGIKWSETLVQRNDYEEAEEVLITLLDQYQNEQQLQDRLKSIYLEWCRFLMDAGNYENASAILEKAGQRFPSEKSFDSALLFLYLDWSDALLRDGEYVDGAAKFTIAIGRWPDSDEIIKFYNDSIELLNNAVEQTLNEEQSKKARMALHEIHITVGQYWIALAEKNLQNVNLTREYLKKALESFQLALAADPGSSFARQWIDWLDFDIANANPVIVHQGQSCALNITDPVMTKVKYLENTKYSYSASSTESDVTAEILDLKFQVDEPEAGYQLIREITYTVNFNAPHEITAGVYQLVLTIETKLYNMDISKSSDERWREWLANPGNFQQFQSALQPQLMGIYRITFYILVLP